MKDLVSPAVFYGFPCIWVLGVYALVQIMMSKKPVNVKAAMSIYNVVQIVVCGYMVWGLLPCIGFPNFCGLNSGFDEKGEWFVFVHYLSKYLDWFDTLWMILKRKSGQQMSFLHLYHHSTIGVVWGFLLCTGHGNGA